METQKQDDLCKELVPDFGVKVPVYNNNSTIKQGTFTPKSGTIFRISDIIRIIAAGNPEPFSTQTSISTGDRITVNTHAKDGTTTFIAFLDIQKDKVHKFFEEFLNCPCVSQIEQDGKKHIYIILNRVSAIKAKSWAKELRDSIGIKCRIFPNSVSSHKGKSETITINPNSSFFIHNVSTCFNVDLDWLSDPVRLAEIAEQRTWELEMLEEEKSEAQQFYFNEITEEDEEAYMDELMREMAEEEEKAREEALQAYNEQIQRDCREAAYDTEGEVA